MRTLGRLVARHPWLVLCAALALTLMALWPASRLRLETRLVALLPDGSPAARDYAAFLEHFGGFEKVFVLVRATGEAPAGEDRAATVMQAVQTLEAKLDGDPLIAETRAGLEDADLDFFLRFVVRRAPLLLDEEALAPLYARLEPAAVAGRGGELAAALRAPGGEARVPLLVHDPLGFAEALPALRAGQGGLPIDLLTSTFLTSEGDLGLLIVSPAASELDPESGRKLEALLDSAFAAAKAESVVPLEMLAMGGPLYAAQDERLMREDLESTISISGFACLALLVVAFGSVRIPLASFIGLSVGMVWTAGLLGLALGELTAVSLGFAAVLIGLGDYGIYLGARFHDRVLRGEAPPLAMEETFAEISAGLWSSALTIALAFGALAAAHFRPLREVGLVVGLGMVLMLFGSLTAGAALMVRKEGKKPLLFQQNWQQVWHALQRWIDGLVALAQRRPRLILGVSTALALLGLLQIFRLELTADLRVLRPANHPALAAEQLLAERFGMGIDTSTVLVEGEDLDQALERAEAARALLEREGHGRISIVSPTDWLTPAPRAEARLAELGRRRFAAAADELEVSLRAANLNPAAFAPGLEALRAFGAGRDPGSPARKDWPSGLDELVADDGGRWWAALHLRIPRDLWPEGPPPALGDQLRAISPEGAVASVVRIGHELRDLAIHDVETLMLLAAIGVALVVVVSFRGNLRWSLIAALPVTIGSAWSLGLWSAIGRPLDLLSLIAVPILFGIGIHDGLHSAHGVDERGIAHAVREAGAALFLTGGTTVMGFGSLAFSQIPGLQNSGILVAIGVSACWLATVLVLPALEAWRKAS